jgi:peptidyl-prolyl cis-trans isomerase A (cyclophilin A)
MSRITGIALATALLLLAGCSSTPEETEEKPKAEETQTESPAEEAPAVEPKAEPEDAVAARDEPAEEVKKAAPKPTPKKVEKKKAMKTDPATPNPALTNPALANDTAPETFKVQFETTKGDVVLEINRAWAPRGADRFYNLVKIGYFQDIAFFRVIDGFMAQFGIHGDAEVNSSWDSSDFRDDPVTQSNKRGYITFATRGPNTRSTQFFINFSDNSFLDSQGFSPFGRVVEGMEVMDSIYKGYGEGAPRGRGPDQGRIKNQGNSYLKKDFPDLDYIKGAKVVK